MGTVNLPVAASSANTLSCGVERYIVPRQIIGEVSCCPLSAIAVDHALAST